MAASTNDDEPVQDTTAERVAASPGALQRRLGKRKVEEDTGDAANSVDLDANSERAAVKPKTAAPSNESAAEAASSSSAADGGGNDELDGDVCQVAEPDAFDSELARPPHSNSPPPQPLRARASRAAAACSF